MATGLTPRNWPETVAAICTVDVELTPGIFGGDEATTVGCSRIPGGIPTAWLGVPSPSGACDPRPVSTYVLAAAAAAAASWSMCVGRCWTMPVLVAPPYWIDWLDVVEVVN